MTLTQHNHYQRAASGVGISGCSVCCFICCLVFWIIALVSYNSTIQNSIETTGLVIDYTTFEQDETIQYRRSPPISTTCYTPEVSFETVDNDNEDEDGDGESIVTSSLKDLCYETTADIPWSIGDSIDILYMENDPEEIYEVESTYLGKTVSAWFVGICVVSCVGCCTLLAYCAKQAMSPPPGSYDDDRNTNISSPSPQYSYGNDDVPTMNIVTSPTVTTTTGGIVVVAAKSSSVVSQPIPFHLLDQQTDNNNNNNIPFAEASRVEETNIPLSQKI